MAVADRFLGVQKFFRRSRMGWFARTFAVSDATNIIDVGGTNFNWELIGARPRVTMVNISGEEWVKDNLRYLVYDGTKLPFPDKSFDIAYSNSVIEHVGDWNRMRNFAAEIRRMADAYYVQTPNRGFFLEPHYMGFFTHWMKPDAARKWIPWLSVWGWRHKLTKAQIDRQLAGTRLLTVEQVRELFPEAEIFRERFFGMTKSIVAAKFPKKNKPGERR